MNENFKLTLTYDARARTVMVDYNDGSDTELTRVSSEDDILDVVRNALDAIYSGEE